MLTHRLLRYSTVFLRVALGIIEREDRTEVRLVRENLPDEYSEYVKAGRTAALGELAGQLAAEVAS